MANLLNVIPQANSNKTSPIDGSLLKNSAENPAKLESKELKELFQKKLSENLSAEVLDEKNAEIPADLSEVALAAGALKQPVVVPTELKKTPVAVSTEKNPLKDVKGAAIATAGIQVQNQLPMVGQKTTGVKATDVKTAENKADLKMMTPTAQAAILKSNEMIANGSSAQPISAEMAAMMAAQGLTGMPSENDFNVESLEVLPKETSSKLSTTDFLNLRDISQKQIKPNLVLAAQNSATTDPTQLAPLVTTGAVIGMKPTLKQKSDEKKDLNQAMNGLAPAHQDQNTFGKTLDATVTQGANQKTILSPTSLTQITNQVNLLGQARQDGEIKIKLRPDHLGELQMSIRTQGQNVSVQIKAENNEAKKIIEDSLGALRDHLSLQNLSLAKIDVVIQPTAQANLEQTQMQFDSNQNFNQSAANEGGRNNSQDGSQQSGREFFRDDSNLKSIPSSMIRPKMTDSTRLDLIA